MMFGQWPKSHKIFKQPAKALIRLRVCAGWSEPLLVAYTTYWKSHVAAHITFSYVRNDQQKSGISSYLFDTIGKL